VVPKTKATRPLAQQENKMNSILNEVGQEHSRQDKIQGDYRRSTWEFIDLIDIQKNHAETAADNFHHKEYRKHLVQVAALAIAAIESIDRKI